MSDTVINLLLQIPLAGVVVFVVVLFLRHLEKSTSAMMTFMTAQEESNREFLKAQREANNTAIARLAEEIKGVREGMAKMNGLLSKRE